MEWFEIDLLPDENRDFVFLREPFPEEVRPYRYKIMEGSGRFDEEYPEEPKVYMSDNEPGMVLPDLIGTTQSALIVSKRVKEIMENEEDVDMGPVEYLPIWIHNHKRRLASKDYFIINLQGSYDVVDEEASDIHRVNGQVVTINKLVFDARKCAEVPDLIRIDEEPERYFVNSNLMYFLTQVDPQLTNFMLYDVEVSHLEDLED